MSHAEEIIERCATEVAALCENTGMKLAALDQNGDLASMAVAFAIASKATLKIQEKILALPGGEEWMDSVLTRKLDS